MNKADRLVLKLINEVLDEYIFEAEEEGNPFAAAADAGGDKAADAAGAAGGDAAAEEGEEEKDKEKKPAEQDGLTFNFDVSAVKKYNNSGFRGDTAVAKKITKNGIMATVTPDEVDVLVGFDDITEQAKAFFKNK